MPIGLPIYANILVFGAGLVTVLAWLLAGLLGALLASQPVVLADEAVTAGLRAVASKNVLEVLTWISRLHGTAGILAMCALTASWLAWRNKPALLPVLAASVPGGLLLNAIVKLSTERARPDVLYATERLSTFSFPSGHTAGATVLYGFLVVLVWRHTRSVMARAGTVAFALAAVAMVGASRVVLGLHYPSDCLAAVAEGVLWLSMCVGAARALRA